MVLFTSIIFKKLLSIIPTTFPFDSGSRVDNVRHTSGYCFMLDPASNGNIVGMIRQMTTAF